MAAPLRRDDVLRRAGRQLDRGRPQGALVHHNMGSSSGHVAAVFHDDGNAYIVSMHMFGTVDQQQTREMVRRMVAGLVAVPQSM